jgi:predicted component of type VI protein secretion system
MSDRPQLPKPRPQGQIFGKEVSSAPRPSPKLEDSGQSTAVIANGAPAGELVVFQGKHAGKRLALSAGTVAIGRSSQCQLSLRAANGVSRRHCKITYTDQGFVLADLESRNGTVVNGTVVAKAGSHHILRHGDVLDVGDERIRFLLKGEASPSPPPPRPVAGVMRDAARPPTLNATRLPSSAPSTTNLLIAGAVGACVVLLAFLVLGGDDDKGNKPPPPDRVVATQNPVDVVKATNAGSNTSNTGNTNSTSNTNSTVPVAVPVANPSAIPVAAAAGMTPIHSPLGGRVMKVLVKVGDDVAAGAELVVVDTDTGAVRRKIDLLRREAREFEAIAKTDKSARADLASIQRDIANLEKKLKVESIRADRGGRVGAMLVDVGASVKPGQPIAQLVDGAR